MFEIGLLEQYFICASRATKRVPQKRPANLESCVLGGWEGAAGKPGCDGGQRFPFQTGQILGENPDLFQFSFVGRNSSASSGKVDER